MRLFQKSNWEIRLGQWIKTEQGARFLLASAVVLSSFLAYGNYPKVFLRLTGTHTEGIVKKVTDKPRHRLIIEFDYYAADKLIRGRERVYTRFPSSYGKEPVNIWYDPLNPEIIANDLDGTFSFLFSLFLPPCLVLAAIANLLKFKSKKHGSKKRSRE